MSKWFLLLMVVMCCSFRSVAQNNNQVSLVRVGSIDSAHTTISQILSDPRIICSDRNCKVVEFTMSLTTSTGETYGPFVTSGAELSDQQKIKIKELNTYRTVMTIDNIRMVCNGDQSQEVWTRPIVLRFGY